MRRIALRGASIDADTTIRWCQHTAEALGALWYEGPFVHPIVNDDLLGPVPARVWEIVQDQLIACGARFEPIDEFAGTPSRRSEVRVLIVHPHAPERTRLVVAFAEAGLATLGMGDTSRALMHLRSIGADVLVTELGLRSDRFIASARAIDPRLRLCVLIGASRPRGGGVDLQLSAKDPPEKVVAAVRKALAIAPPRLLPPSPGASETCERMPGDDASRLRSRNRPG